MGGRPSPSVLAASGLAAALGLAAAPACRPGTPDAPRDGVRHDQAELMTLADRIVVLRYGAVEQFGTPREVYGAPATAFVAGFVGTPRMNLVAPSVLGIEAEGVEAGLRPEDPRVETDPGSGGPVRISFDPTKLHHFSSATGRRLAGPSP